MLNPGLVFAVQVPSLDTSLVWACIITRLPETEGYPIQPAISPPIKKAYLKILCVNPSQEVRVSFLSRVAKAIPFFTLFAADFSDVSRRFPKRNVEDNLATSSNKLRHNLKDAYRTRENLSDPARHDCSRS